MWIGSHCSAKLSRVIGKRPTLILMTLPLLVSFIMLAFLRQMWLMYVARILGGITNGGMFTLLPIYFGEVADPRNRGILGAAFNLFLNVGLLFSLCLGPYTTYRMFNLVLAACVLIYAILITIIIPESPYFLMEKDQDKAEETLKRIRGVDDVKQELKQIQQYLELEAGEKGSLLEMIASKSARTSLIIGIGLASFQQCSGISIIMGFGQMIFEEVEGFLPSDLSLIILGFSQVVFGLVAPIFTDRFGRRFLLIISYAGIAMSLTTFGIYFILKKHGISVDGISWLPLVSMTFFMFAFGIGAGAVTFIVIGEIFSSKMKGPATSIANILASITGLLLTNLYKILKEAIGTGYTFWILGFIGVIAALFSAHFVVETRGKTLKEIQEILNKDDSHKSQTIEL
ncbi:facilitated trehalose transporter Tret1-like isoform X2 [Coccinella septempunctata]|nr:facilitated trehalose transporter Tret1-like isoform X2 [Coccinella septempunctata]XP_044766565.1 facilitated trehalose transporter Tret1-like isoform X2 [Coccinella septempunctata]